jgi:hypothetical protein
MMAYAVIRLPSTDRLKTVRVGDRDWNDAVTQAGGAHRLTILAQSNDREFCKRECRAAAGMDQSTRRG